MAEQMRKQSVCSVRGCVIGAGMPKICVPLVGETQDELRAAAEQAVLAEPDLIEWRADSYLACAMKMKGIARQNEGASVQNAQAETISCGSLLPKLLFLLKEIRTSIGERPLLFTIRTAREGGSFDGNRALYLALNRAAAESGDIDLIDYELERLPEETLRGELSHAKACGVRSVVSYHSFRETPDAGALVRLLCRMQETGADLPKIAVMPQDAADVLTLLQATDLFHSEKADRPFITMSMGKEGMISRVSGELFGSAITFGSAGRRSAPGQLDAHTLRSVLLALHGGADAEMPEKKEQEKTCR